MFEEEEPKDWEMKDEDPPESLKRKWEWDEAPDRGTVICPACKKEISSGNLACIFCGSVISQASCPGRCFLAWVKRLFKRG